MFLIYYQKHYRYCASSLNKLDEVFVWELQQSTKQNAVY